MPKDETCSKLRSIMLRHRIYDKENLRLVTEGILCRMRTGCPWRDLPEVFGYWNTVYKRFNDWSRKKKLIRIFKSLSEDIDLEWGGVDASIVKAHQHNSGGSEPQNQAIGKSKGSIRVKCGRLFNTLIFLRFSVRPLDLWK
uniref:Transposase of IS4/5 family (DUF4096) n=1 Tax=Candidatus Kentrum eta TaxID=2126337 RepID=A0A450VFB2_9GAMM|nr:MAG: Putative transposase of IS4/5 family (DUF4096) [Candidatus Kentron sp. H]VFK03850.1 MAG: Putative transposase of IS4/5 family (DUF4096) [Candidatus Kentron sp. H]VFK06984.1 MAG: Putative transposase of IS4/5 family (DUF4096) [Candidatus Kentron sp. H]